MREEKDPETAAKRLTEVSRSLHRMGLAGFTQGSRTVRDRGLGIRTAPWRATLAQAWGHISVSHVPSLCHPCAGGVHTWQQRQHQLRNYPLHLNELGHGGSPHGLRCGDLLALTVRMVAGSGWLNWTPTDGLAT